MSGFLSDIKEQTANEGVEKWIRMGERAEQRAISPDLFNLMVSTAKAVHDSRAGVRVYHWLKWCNSFYKSENTMYLDYVDLNSANWALNYIGDGVKFSQKVHNVVTLHNGKHVNSLYTPERKFGEVSQLHEF